MALLSLNLDPKRASTHAFVVGVGTYPHLDGGSTPNTTLELGLGQLSSPPLSAQRFIRWLLEEFHNDKAPLATIEHLISAPHQVQDKQGKNQPSEEPTFANLETAYKRWIDRASENEDNIAIFYFCGHGMAKGAETALLAADFGNPAVARLTKNAIHLEDTVKGMFACKANQQCFFIDTCRTKDERLEKLMSSAGEPLGEASADDVRVVQQPVIFASSLTQRALAQDGAVSAFTQSLIEALDGMAADDDAQGSFAPGECVVKTELLCRAIRESLELQRLEKPWLGGPECTDGGGGSFHLHFPQRPVRVPLLMKCEPAEVETAVTLSITRDGSLISERTGASGPWLTWQEPSFYKLAATLANGQKEEKTLMHFPAIKKCGFKFNTAPLS